MNAKLDEMIDMTGEILAILGSQQGQPFMR
jgi:hypothetical protein